MIIYFAFVKIISVDNILTLPRTQSYTGKKSKQISHRLKLLVKLLDNESFRQSSQNVVCKLLFNNSENVMHANIILSFLNQRKQNRN